MRFSLRNRPFLQASGFTLIEVLIIAPAVIIVISGFVALMIALTSDVLATREQSVLAFETQDALDRIEQDTRLTTQFLVTSGAQTAPQGSDSNFTGTAPFSSTTSLIMGGLTTDKNPVDSTRQLIYYTKQPNDCGALQTYNRVFQAKVIYFIKNGSLWRRAILPSYNTNPIVDDNTVCSTPWQRNTCSPGYSASICATNDTEVMKGIKTFTVKYYNSAGGTTDIGSAQALNATTIEVNIEGEKTIAGRAITTSGIIRGTKLNNIDVDLPAPSTPSLSGSANATSAVFTWSKVPVATSYVVSHNINGGAWTEVTLNAQATSYTVNANLNDTVTLRVTARNTTGSSSAGQTSVTIPYWNTCALQNGWVNYENTYTTAAYTKTNQEVVVLKGLIRNGNAANGTVLCVLPSGYRPTHRLIFPVVTSDGNHGQQGRIDVLPTGEVVIVEGSNQWISFDNIRFLSSTASYAWTNLSLVNNWVNWGNEFSPLRSAKDTSGRTHIEGLIKDGIYTPNATPVTTLPLVHRPSQYMHFPAKANMAFNYTAVGANIDAKGINPNGWYNIQAMFYASAFAGWTNLPLQNGWVSFDSGGHSTPQYTRSTDKIVTVKGLIKGGNATADFVIAQLPAGYRPKERTINHCVAWAAFCRIDIRPDGYIEVRVANTGWTSLDAISFIAEQ